MNFWFVNHNMSSVLADREDYLWVPKKASPNRTYQYYENMRRLKPGDIILAYFEGGVQGYGVALTYSYTFLCPPQLTGEWNPVGWRCDVKFRQFPTKVEHAQHSQELLAYSFGREEVAPLDSNGRIHQGSYLSRVKPEFVEIIARSANDEDLLNILSQGHADIDENHAIDTIDYRQSLLDDLEAEKLRCHDENSVKHLLQARYGTGPFREQVTKIETSCRITNRLYNYDLVACHIKPWREADSEEKIQGANGLLLAPNAAQLFSCGLFSFDNDGSLIRSAPMADNGLLTKILPEDGLQEKRFNSDQKHFLEHHREYVLLKPYRKT